MKKVIAPSSAIVAAIGGLRVGESVTYPVERANSVKVTCSSYGLSWGKRFKTNIDREARTITVTRVSLSKAKKTK